MEKDPGNIPMDDPLALFLTWTTNGSGRRARAGGETRRFRQPNATREQAARVRADD